ncbi:hypothetical protein JV46_09290 [Solemya velum gill symbiont]|uniref:Uncharacterized protein n=1 Tax=Solemya velum gill symbiont TaxID=2340 RepID=A0A0B0HAZ3_SOVGS|nr:hypothetical protein JV46_09290 [Solemya velum gill symbiont]
MPSLPDDAGDRFISLKKNRAPACQAMMHGSVEFRNVL